MTSFFIHLIKITTMKNNFKTLGFSLWVMGSLMLASCSGSKYEYTTVPNDPMNTQMYTLKNGLKVYMTVNKETTHTDLHCCTCGQ